VACKRCGVGQVKVPWARPGSGFTLLFEMLVLQLSREMSVAAVAELTSEHANRIWRILSHYVEKPGWRWTCRSSGTGIDEFSLRKGHDYMTSFSDLEAARVIFLGESRKKGVIREFVEDLRNREISPGQIEVVCCDLWDPYLNGLRAHLPQAGVVFDRFHVMAHINQAIEKVRREEQQEKVVLKKTRYLWLKNPKNLTGKQAVALEQLKQLDLKTARAYHLKLALARFWEIADPTEAAAYLKRWYFWATHSRLSPVIEAPGRSNITGMAWLAILIKRLPME